jgi:hypothetical protein
VEAILWSARCCGRCAGVEWGSVVVGCLDDDRAGACGGEAGLVGGDVLNGVGCCLGRVELDGVHRGAVDVGCDAEVEVLPRTGDGGTEVVVVVPFAEVASLTSYPRLGTLMM